MYFIIGGDGKQYGPISEADLRKWIVEGRLNGQSQARAESEAEFRALASFPEFAAVLGIAPPGLAPLPGALPLDNRAASGKVAIPAIGLMVSASVSLLMCLYSLVSLPSTKEKYRDLDSQMEQLNNPQLEQFMHGFVQFMTGPFGIACVIFQIIIAILILVGAIKMKALRSYHLAYAAAIISVVPCISPCCGWILGLIFGIWAMIVLAKPEVKSQFS